MKLRTRLFALTLVASLTSCATSDHYNATREQTAAWERVEIARAQASAKRFDALTAAAHNGSDIARVVVAMALAGIGGAHNLQSTHLPQVSDPNEAAYKWASLILPTTTAVAAGYFGYKLGTTQSNNSALTSIAGYQTMGGIANSGFAGITTTAGLIQAPQPNITTTTTNTTTNTNTNNLAGTGVLGSGTYTRNCPGGTSTGNPSAPSTGGSC
jgi:hypothetical protein